MRCMLTKNGLVLKMTPDLRKQLTVTPVVSVGFPKKFKVFLEDTKGNACIPQYFCESTKDFRTDPETITKEFKGALRDYQQEALDRFFENTKTGGVLSLGCGLGKTCVALAIACRLGLKTLVLVHKEFLANQWRERIREFVPDASIGLIQGPAFDIHNKDFVIGMIQTICQENPRDFTSFGLLIVDEAHHIGAPVFSQCLFKVCTKYTLGLTATPERADGLTRLLYWFLGPEFYRLENKQHATVHVHKHDPVNPPAGIVDLITWLCDLPKRNELIVDIINKCQGRKVLVLSDRRLHCEFLQKQIPYSALYMGGMSREVLEAAEKNSVIIGTYSLANEGLDIPDLDTLIMATPKSAIKQTVGRILRGCSKNPPVVHDIQDSCLYGMWHKRKLVYEELGFTIRTLPGMPKQIWQI